jgi:hypothetical protein
MYFYRQQRSADFESAEFADSYLPTVTRIRIREGGTDSL